MSGEGPFQLDFEVDVPDGYTLVGVLQWSLNNRVNISVSGINVNVTQENTVSIWGKSNTTYSYELHPYIVAILIKN